MSIVSHRSIELSFYKYLNTNLEVSFSYPINYGNVRFEGDPYDIWLSVAFEEKGAGAKQVSPTELDVITRVSTVQYPNDETTALDRIREVLTNADIDLYSYPAGNPSQGTLVVGNKILVKNDEGRMTVNNIVLNNLKAGDLQQNLRRSTVFFNLKLLSDTSGGRVI